MTHAPNDDLMDPFEVPGLVDRYLAGEASPVEIAEMQRWIQADSSHRRLIQAMISAHEVISAKSGPLGSTEIATTRALETIRQRAQGAGYRQTKRPYTQRQKYFASSSIKSWGFAMGAGMLLAAVAVFGMMRDSASVSTLESAEALRYVTTQAERARIELADGSTVLLAPESRLVVSAEFGQTSRTIELDGEALFTVPRSIGRPFVVHTAGSQTRVLGTVFSVRQYRRDSSARVRVAEGKVKVAPDGGDATGVVTIGEEAVVAGDGSISVRSNVDMATALGWTQGRQVFTAMPLGEVLADTRRLFGFDIRLSRSLARSGFAQRSVSGMITEQMRVQDAAALLAGILGVRVVRDGSVFTLTE